MSYKVQHRNNELQQNSLFHHSLIKIIVLHQLKQLGIDWETFIGEEVFLPSSNQLARPTSSSTPPAQTEIGSSSRSTMKKKKGEDKVVKTYQRGNSLVIAPQVVEGAKPSTSAQHGSLLYHETTIKANEDPKTIKQPIVNKENELKSLQDKLTEVNALIACLQQENMQLKVDMMLQEKHIMKLQKETKGKQKSKTKGSKKALQQQRKQVTLDELIDREIDENTEYCLGKVNDHLEKLLKKENKDKRLQKHMAAHYYTWNMILNVKVKQMKH